MSLPKTQKRVDFTFHLNQQTEIAIRISDANGQIVYEMSEKIGQEGAFTHRLSLQQWPAGLYFCTYRYGDTVKTQKLVVQ